MADEFCGSCGRQGRPIDRFCRGCGDALTDDAAAANPMNEAEALAARGQLSEAVATIQRAIGQSETAELHVALAALYLRRGSVAEAERELHTAIELDPACAVAHAYAGCLFLQRGLVVQAEEALDEARALAPNDLLVARKRAEFFLALGILERARDELHHGLSEGGGTQEMRMAAAQLFVDIERRLSRSVTRHTVALPNFRKLRQLIGRRGSDTDLKTIEVEA